MKREQVDLASLTTACDVTCTSAIRYLYRALFRTTCAVNSLKMSEVLKSTNQWICILQFQYPVDKASKQNIGGQLLGHVNAPSGNQTCQWTIFILIFICRYLQMILQSKTMCSGFPIVMLNVPAKSYELVAHFDHAAPTQDEYHFSTVGVYPSWYVIDSR